jgi:hypothetical protein
MRSPRQSRFPHLALLSLIPLVMALVACGATTSIVGSTATATKVAPTATPPPPSASMLQVVAAQHFADSKSGGTTAPCANGDPLINGDCGQTVTATCASGDVVLGGGFQVDDPLAFVTSSFPSGATAWTVTAHDEGQDGGSHPVTITAYAECLHANFTAVVSIASSTPNIPNDSNFHEVSVNCPAGSVVTGGGFRGTNSTQEIIPAANGWTVGLGIQQGASTKPSLYALCAGKHLVAASMPMTTANPNLGTGTSLTVSCPAASLLTSGGVHTVSYGNLTNLAANGALTQWLATISALGVVGGPPSTYAVAEYAVCVTVS